MKKIIINFMAFLCLLLLSSCTHSLNIDTKLFVSAIGVDIGENNGISICLAYPDISEFSPESSKIKGTNSMCGFGKSFYEALEDVVIKTNKTVDLEHVKIVLLSEKLVNDFDVFQNILDYLAHNPQISRRVHVSICNGEINDFLNFKNSLEEHSQIFISELMQINSKENGLKLVTLNNLLDYFSQNKTILIPTLKLNDNKNKMYVSGSYVFDEYRLLDEFNLEETRLINFLRGDTYKILNEVSYMGSIIDYEGEHLKRKIKVVDYENLGVVLNYNVKTIIKNCINPKHNYVDNKFVEDVKDILNYNIKNNCINLVNRCYKNNIDILNFENHIYKFHTNLWNGRINEKNQWMKELKVVINIDNDIINIGNISF